MSEEQKNAIDELKSMREYFEFQPEGCNWRLSFNEEEVHTIIDVIINLIDKQQKEIEQLANGIRVLGTNPDITTEEIIKEFTEKPITEEYMQEFKSRYISKDKIRDILLKFQNKYSPYLETTDRLFIGKEVVQYGEDILDEIAAELDIELLEE